MIQSSDRFVYEERIAVRFGSAQMALKAWIAAVRRRDAGRGIRQDDGSFLFVHPTWARRAVRAVVSISVVPDSDLTTVRIELSGKIRNHWLQRRRCRSMLRRLLVRAKQLNHDVNPHGPGGGHRVISGTGVLVPVPLPVGRSEFRHRQFD